MPYTTNPQLPKVRMQAVMLIRRGWSTRAVARHLGFNQSTIVKWLKRAPRDGRETIPTRSARPQHHPRALPREVTEQIVAVRLKRRRCAEVIHEELRQHGLVVSLSSVKRILDRCGLTKKRSPWQRYHPPMARPVAEKPGDLVELDTIHVVPRNGERFYVYTLIDVYSRWAWAKATERINTHRSARFVREAQCQAPFSFGTLQSDHGSEFSAWFTEHVGKQAIVHRHSRVRRPNDNGHLERFNRTIQEECRFRFLEQSVPAYQRAITGYLPYYNGERLHLGLNLKTPLQVMPSY